MIFLMFPSDGPGSGETNQKREITLEWRGRFSSKVQLAETFKSAYQVIDGLSQPGVGRLTIVYHSDFKVDPSLVPSFLDASKEALAYKDALTFGQRIETQVTGHEAIADATTRQVVANLIGK
jgi:hypothetical protein